MSRQTLQYSRTQSDSGPTGPRVSRKVVYLLRHRHGLVPLVGSTGTVLRPRLDLGPKREQVFEGGGPPTTSDDERSQNGVHASLVGQGRPLPPTTYSSL